MKNMVLAVLITLVGCATQYQPDGLMGGYSDEEIGTGKYLVTFKGNGFTSASDVQSFALKRAREICSENHYKKYDILSVVNDTERSMASQNTSCVKSSNGQNIDCVSKPGFQPSKASTTAIVQCSFLDEAWVLK